MHYAIQLWRQLLRVMSSSENKIVNRTICSMSKVCRKQPSERVDLVSKLISHEIGCLEIGLEDKGENGTKEMSEKVIKTLLMTKNFAYHLVQHHKTERGKIANIGLVISGLGITGLVMSHDKGFASVAHRTERLNVLESVASDSETDLQSYPSNERNYDFLTDSASSVPLENNELICFPPYFVSTEAISRKRKASFSMNNEE